MSARGGGGLQRLSRLLFLAHPQHHHHPPSQSWSSLLPHAAGPSSGGISGACMRRLALSTKATTTTTNTATTTASTKSQFDRWREALRSAPPTALALGALGVVPFIALSTPVSKHIAWALPLAVSERTELFQVGYGVAIASFLGGVHWGAALSSPLIAGPVAARMAAERLAWGVVPSLLAWPLVAMEPGPASALLSALIPALYLVDRRFARRGLLPLWYMALRAPLTLGATFGCLLTASYHAHLEADRVAAAAAGADKEGKGAKAGKAAAAATTTVAAAASAAKTK